MSRLSTKDDDEALELLREVCRRAAALRETVWAAALESGARRYHQSHPEVHRGAQAHAYRLKPLVDLVTEKLARRWARSPEMRRQLSKHGFGP